MPDDTFIRTGVPDACRAQTSDKIVVTPENLADGAAAIFAQELAQYMRAGGRNAMRGMVTLGAIDRTLTLKQYARGANVDHRPADVLAEIPVALAEDAFPKLADRRK
jgi:hypothetical protein